MPYLNLAIRCETTLAPLGLLQEAKRIEAEIGRVVGHVWGPRPIDIDILAWDDRVIVDDKLHIPHEHLLERPFALWPLTDVAPHWVYPLPHPHPGKRPLKLQRAGVRGLVAMRHCIRSNCHIELIRRS